GCGLGRKYAVRSRGGVDHRMALGDAVLLKDRIVVAAGAVTAALEAGRRHAPDLPGEVEVDSLDQLREALSAGADEVLLDNFTPEQCSQAARQIGRASCRERGEVSVVDVGRTHRYIGRLANSGQVRELP